MISNFTPVQLAMLVFVTIAVAAGQVLFKYVATTLVLDRGVAALLSSLMKWPVIFAVLLYGVGTGVWLLVLKFTPLSRAYPFMALGFVVVPLFARILFNESLSSTYWLGTAVLVTGLVIIARSST